MFVLYASNNVDTSVIRGPLDALSAFLLGIAIITTGRSMGVEIHPI